MLTHIVCWKYKEEISDEVRRDHRERLGALKAVIPEVIDLKVGADMLHLERSYDTGLVATFADADALNAYTVHPTHQQVAAMGKEIAAHVVSVDFVDQL
ncbi:MAG: Dabb family protein [Pyrinomonadaceae bacterium]